MADTTPTVDPVTPAAPSNEPSTPPVPVVVNSTDNGEVERLRKEKEQAEMRANQLANQLKAREDADSAAAQAKLEEDNQYKELFEQEKAKREALETEQTEAQRTAELARVKAEALSGVSDDVKKLAEELGIGLTDTDEKSVETYKEKLGKISASAPRVAANNPGVSVDQQMSVEELRETLYADKTGDKFHEIVMKMPGIASMTGK